MMCLYRSQKKFRTEPLEHVMENTCPTARTHRTCPRERTTGSTEVHICPVALIQPLQTKEIVQHSAGPTST